MKGTPFVKSQLEPVVVCVRWRHGVNVKPTCSGWEMYFLYIYNIIYIH